MHHKVTTVTLEHDFVIKYVQDTEMPMADALSKVSPQAW